MMVVRVGVCVGGLIGLGLFNKTRLLSAGNGFGRLYMYPTVSDHLFPIKSAKHMRFQVNSGSLTDQPYDD
jgi:hypothetical protein